MEQKLFWRLADVKGSEKVTYGMEVKPAAVDHSFESLNSEVIYFLLSAVFGMLKVFLSYGQLAEYKFRFRQILNLILFITNS